MPFVTTLELPDLNQLTNDPIAHSPWWLVIPTTFPIDIPKFHLNPGEDPFTHVLLIMCGVLKTLSMMTLSVYIFSSAHLSVWKQDGILNYHELRLVILAP